MIRFHRLVALTVVLSITLGCGARVDPEVERRRQEERAAEHRLAYAEGLAHLEAGEHDAAVTAFEKAHALAPTDADTADWLGRARAGKQKHISAQYEKAMAAGRDAVTAGKHRAAKAAFADALHWKPNDPDAVAAQGRAEIPALVEQGREQFDAKQFADATRTFLDAARKAPANTGVRELLKQAQDARRAEVRDEYEKAMTAGRAAMSEKNYLAASRSFTRAAELVPDDAAALAERLAADFEHHIRRGQDARAANRPAEAVAEFEIATRLKPQDEHALALLRDARRAKVDADKARYTQTLTDAKVALAGRRYRDAVRLAKQAEDVVTDHAEATQVRRNAERAIGEYDQWVNKAKTAIQRKRYDEALTAADEAARLMPGETEPILLRSEAARKKLDQSAKK